MVHGVRAREPSLTRRCRMEALETYTSALAVLSTALVLVAARLAKEQLVWRRAKPVPARRRRSP
jgi:hypothetical protein